MKKFSRLLLLVGIISLLFSLSACTEEYPNSEDVYDENGEYLYSNLNKNYFAFDTYNALEVTVDENEKFILYDVADDGEEYGFGEWIRDGVAVMVVFTNDGDSGYDRHGDLIVSRDDYNPYDTSASEAGYIARIANDSEAPSLRKWRSGHFPYDVKFNSERISVDVATHTVEQPFDTLYLPQCALSFYGIDQESENTYYCDEIGLAFDRSTGEGSCIINGEAVPITVFFDMERFELTVRYNTADDRKGVTILSALGESIKETEATYSIMSTSEFSNISAESITVRK